MPDLLSFINQFYRITMKMFISALIAITTPFSYAEEDANLTSAPPARADQQQEAAAEPADPAILGNISEIYRDRRKAIATIQLQANGLSNVSVQTAPGEACEGLVESAEAKNLTLDFSKCADFEKIKPGAPLRKSPLPSLPFVPAALPEVKKVSTQPPSTLHIGFDFAVGYSSSTELRFDSAEVKTGASSAIGSDIYTVSTAGQVSVGGMLTGEHSWGGYAGLTLQQKRDIKYERAEINGTTAYAISNSTIHFNFVEASAFYRWRHVYLPFGLNYSIVDIGMPPGTGISVDMSGGLGAQLGVGVFLNDHLHLEVLSQALATKIKVRVGTATADLGNGYLSGLTVKLGYLF